MKYNLELADKILFYLEEASPNNDGKVEIEGFSDEEVSYHIKHLEKKGLVEGINASSLGGQKWLATDLTPQGHRYLEEIQNEKQNMETYADKERLVLQTIYETGKTSSYNEVNFDDLLTAVNIPFEELAAIVEELQNRKGYLGNASDGCVKISPAGIEFLQGKSNAPSGSNITYYNIKDSTVGGIQHHTQNSNQFVNQKVSNVTNPEFNDAVKSITELIKTSSLSSFAKEDLISDIERIKQLAEIEPSPELVEHAKSKINYLETAIKVTDLATKLSPYFPILYSYFEKLIQ